MPRGPVEGQSPALKYDDMSGRRWRVGSMGALGIAVAAIVLGVGHRHIQQLAVAVSGPADVVVDARLLLVAVHGNEPALVAMRDELDHIGTPYTVITTSDTPLAASSLSDGSGHGFYNGLIRVACGAGTGPDAASVAALDAYAAAFGVRSACLFAQADPALGLGAGSTVDTRNAPITLDQTPAGASVFGWYATGAPIQVSGVSAVLAAPDAATTPLLVDQSGHAAVAIHRFSDNRELLLLTVDHAPGAAHSAQLLCGVASWVARGVFIGEKRAYLSPQPDDLFIGTVLTDGTTFRMSGDDLRSLASWQRQVQALPFGAQFRITFPFVGAEVNDTDGLTQAARDVGAQFFFVSHTFDHHRLDIATYAQISQELTSNDAVMQKYAFGSFDRTSLVTPDISGLSNAQVMQGALDWGIERLVCDATVASCRSSTPNTGVPNPVVPGMFMIPRLATNLYANVSTPDQWVASYNALAGTGATGAQSLDQILDHESKALLDHLLAGDINPVMFHQTNLRAYDGTHSLMGALLDRVMSAYAALRVLPIVSLPLDEIGARMQDRASRDSAGVTATIVPGKSVTIRSSQAIRVPVTGAVGADAETYGAVTISRVTLAAGAEITVPLVAVTPTDGGTRTDAGVVTTAGALGGGDAAAPVDASPPTSSPTRPQGAVGGPAAAAAGGCSCTVRANGGRGENLGALVLLFAMAAGLLRRSRR